MQGAKRGREEARQGSRFFLKKDAFFEEKRLSLKKELGRRLKILHVRAFLKAQ
jgi:hypothetical protein